MDSLIQSWKNEYSAEITDESVMSIEAYIDQDYATPASDLEKWTGVFNPSSLKEVFKNEYFEDFPIGSTGGDPKFQRSAPSELSLTIMLSNSLVASTDLSTALQGTELNSDVPIMTQVENLLEVVKSVNGEHHQPNFLKVNLGDYLFKGKCKSCDVNIKEFKTDGEAKRAEISLVFVRAESPTYLANETNTNSPDMTHYYVVKEGETLPVISNRIYGSPNYYLQLARVNNLNNFRRIPAGTRLTLPPLDKTSTDG